jgi:hypothetical protein
MGIGTEWTKPRNAVAEQMTQIRLPMLLLPEAHWDFTPRGDVFDRFFEELNLK